MAKDIDLLPWILGAMLAVGAAAAAASDVAPAPAPAAPNARKQLPPGQVWECQVDGQRVFSDTRCGAHASVRHLSELNLMASSAPAGYDRPPRTGYYPPSPAMDEPAPYPSDDEAGYTGPSVIVRERLRREQARRDHRPRARAARP